MTDRNITSIGSNATDRISLPAGDDRHKQQPDPEMRLRRCRSDIRNDRGKGGEGGENLSTTFLLPGYQLIRN